MPIRAAIFDMDGTLVDSEGMTRLVVDPLLAAAGLAPDAVPDAELHGVTWAAIAQRLGAVGVAADAGGLADAWLDCWRRDPPPVVPGSPAALAAARAAGLRVALATSSDRPAVDALLERPAFAGAFDATVCADDIERSKPDPQIFLRAAAALGVPPAECIVFEDSLAGLRGAAAAGMGAVAILLRSADRAAATALAQRAVVDFEHLPPGFFADLAG
jgi:HAD superfamily hydrolase (TIGR01509 family)